RTAEPSPWVIRWACRAPVWSRPPFTPWRRARPGVRSSPCASAWGRGSPSSWRRSENGRTDTLFARGCGPARLPASGLRLDAQAFAAPAADPYSPYPDRNDRAVGLGAPDRPGPAGPAAPAQGRGPGPEDHRLRPGSG